MSDKIKRLLLSAVLCLAPLAAVAGFQVQNGQLLDANGNPFIMRGVNHAHTWWPNTTPQALADIAATGANAVRIVLATGRQWSRNSGNDVAGLIQMCKDNQLIAILEVHDSTGWPEQGSAAHISTSVDYWLSSDIRNAVQGEEDYVIINIANEPFGNGVAASTWRDEHITAISRLRNAGLNHTLMVDAANWGQDWQFIMRDNAQAVFNSDPQRNVVFSVHMYEVYPDFNKVNSYMQAFANQNLPLVVGEFAADHFGSNVDEASVMSRAQHFGFGYLGWSWSGNSSNLSSLDIAVNWNPNNLSSWGNRLINGANGIAQTSQIASVYTAPSPDQLELSAAALSFGASGGNSTVQVTSNRNWNVTDNRSWISVSPGGGSNNGSITVSVDSNNTGGARSGTVTVSAGSLNKTITVNQAASTGGSANIALGKPAQQSSTDGFAGDGSAAVDGNTGTRWASAWSDPQWLSVDLQQRYDIDRVVLNWETAFGRTYQIQVSDDAANWTTIFNTSNGNGGIDDLSVNGSGRYIRLYGTARGTQWGYSLWEFEVYGTPDSNPAPELLEAEAAALTTVTTESDSGASGGQYVDMKASGSITWTVNVPAAGSYQAYIGYRLPFSQKTQTLTAGGTSTDIVFDGAVGQWLEKPVTLNLNSGDNAVTIDAYWGWMHFDYLRLE